MASAVKRKLSSSTDGKAIKVDTTSSPGTSIHTAVDSTIAGTFDEIWLWAYNGDTVNRTLTIQFGDTTAPDYNIIATIPYKSGLIPMVPGLILQNSAVVRALGDATNVLTLTGFVNSIMD